MANVSVDKRTGNFVIRAYAGINPLTHKPHTVSEVVPVGSSQAEIDAACERQDARAAITKGNTDLMTIGTLVWFYLDLCEASEMSPMTLDSYKSYARRHIDPTIGSVPFDKAGPHTFSALYHRLRVDGRRDGKPLATSTIEKIHAMLSGCFTRLIGDGIIDRNPVANLKIERAAANEVVPLYDDDLSKLMSWLTQTLTTDVKDAESYESYLVAAVIWVVVNTGIRRGEAAGLQRKHVRRGSGEIEGGLALQIARVLLQKKDKSGNLRHKVPKGKRTRVVEIDAETSAVVLSLMEIQDALLPESGIVPTMDTQLFIHADGTTLQPREITDAFKSVSQALGLDKDAHLHTLRHTHASYLLEDGASIKEIQNRLGHASAKTTLDTYDHLMPGADAKAAAHFAKTAQNLMQRTSNRFSASFAPTCPLSGEICARFRGGCLEK